jgi:acyl-CoA reductase-like NAD-dependent aldehyde dehydrogenase
MTVQRQEKLFIGGCWRSAEGPTIDVISPNTGAVIGEAATAAPRDIADAVEAARAAFDAPGGWASWEPVRRAETLERFADELETRGPETARRVSMQNGMPITFAVGMEGMAPARVVRYMAGLARVGAIESDRAHLSGGTTTVRHEPIGVVAAIVPWNYPQAIASFKYAPALAAGCTVVLKPSPETVLDSALLAEAAMAAGLPDGVLNIVPADGDGGAQLFAHRDVDKVTFTGSTMTGRAIAATCGQLLRPVTLELGGKSAAIFLDDVDLDAPSLATDLFGATMPNNGQTCHAGTRVLAPRSRYGEVVEFLASFVGSLTVGPSMDPDTQVGPLVSRRHRERVESYIDKGRSDGARVVVGGGRPRGLDDGWFVEPTVFADVDNRSVIAQEEIFGPVLTVIAYDDDSNAVALANDSDYGLGGSVWTADPERGMALARRVRTGTIGVNRYRVDVGAPFGGVKCSGLGRELGPEALQAYQQVKAIYS